MKDKKTFNIAEFSFDHSRDLNKTLKLVDITLKSEKLSEILKAKKL